MNLELLESFGQNYPEGYDGALDCVSLAVTCAFNRCGTLLAVGCNDGRILIWDFLTRGIAKIIMAHTHPICCLSWPRKGLKLLSASTDNNVSTWNVASGRREEMYKFPTPVLKVQFHPRQENLFLVSPMKNLPILVDLEDSYYAVPVEDKSDMMIVSSFDRRGEFIYTGNGHGLVSVYTCPELEVVASFKISSGLIGIRSMAFARRGDSFLLNCTDRIIRVYDTKDVLELINGGDEVEPTQKLQDLVNRTMWKECCFSGDGEYVCAGSARQHSLYIWEKKVGNLVKILHGTRGELLLNVVWHPARAIILSISNGLVSVWAQNQVENWSAFAPNFKELDENVEYEERESEFDIEDEDKSITEDDEKCEEDIEVDVENIEPIAAFCSSDEEGENHNDVLMFLPIDAEVEDLEPEILSNCSSPVSATPKSRIFDILLNNDTADELLHPLLSSNTYEKQNGNTNDSKKETESQ